MKKRQSQKSSNKKIQASKFLIYILRHSAKQHNLNIDSSGFVKVSDIINLKDGKKYNFTIELIKEIVAEDNKGRFELTKNEPYLIRCVQGHSMKEVENESALNKLNKYTIFNYPTIIHGTYNEAYKLIEKSGLNKMNRNDIHFSIGFNWENQVKSGMRNSCDIFIEINMVYAFFNNIDFFISLNNVVLSSGIDGIIPVKFFKRVLDKNQNLILGSLYDFFIDFENGKITLKKNKNEILIEMNGDFNDFEKLNNFIDLCIEKEFFKEKIITIISEDNKNKYVNVLKNYIENCKILYPQVFVDYVLKNESGIYKSDKLEKIDIDWEKFYSNKNNNNQKNSNNENKEDKKDENIIPTTEKLTKEILLDDTKQKFYILMFNNYDDDGYIESIDILILNSSKLDNILNQTNIKFTSDKTTKKNYENFIYKLKSIIQSLNIINKRLVVCISSTDRDFLVQDLYKYSIIPPKLLLRNIILLNEEDFSLINDEEGNFYKATIKIFISNYLSTKQKINELKII